MGSRLRSTPRGVAQPGRALGLGPRGSAGSNPAAPTSGRIAPQFECDLLLVVHDSGLKQDHPVSPPALFAGLRVRDLRAARAWYDRLLGEPSFFPIESEAVWMLADERSIYIREDPARAGDGLAMVWVDDLDGAISEIAARGLEPTSRETLSNGVRKVTFRDSDGNEVSFGGAPLSE